jgi:hypothetical protein
MKGKFFIFSSAIVLALCFCSSVTSADEIETKETEAINASKAWLEIIDNGNYALSWKQASEYFRNALGSEQWEQMLSTVRKPLGKIVKRTVKSKQYSKTLPGLPDGEYVMIQYETEFEHKKSAIETVTPMLEKDGKWRVSGYFIK